MLKRFDDVRVLELDRDFPLARFVGPLETGFDGLGLGAVKNLEANDLSGAAVPRHVKTGHRARDRFAQQLEAPSDVKGTRSAKQRFQTAEQIHGNAAVV